MKYFILLHAAFAEEAEASGFTYAEIWEHSGTLARIVILMLLIMLVSSAFIVIERLLAHNRARKRSMQLAAAVGPKFASGDLAGALELTAQDEYKEAYLGAILAAGLKELKENPNAAGLHYAERAVEKAVGLEIARLRRFMPVLATVGSTAPFVGLFGTTFGVINAFQGMATAGSGLASISAGISEALITTGVGIGVAVVGVWCFNYFNNRVDKVAEELASSEIEFLDWAEKMIEGKRLNAAAN